MESVRARCRDQVEALNAQLSELRKLNDDLSASCSTEQQRCESLMKDINESRIAFNTHRDQWNRERARLDDELSERAHVLLRKIPFEPCNQQGNVRKLDAIGV